MTLPARGSGPLKVAVFGASGRMGREILALIENNPALHLSGASASPAQVGQVVSGSEQVRYQSPAEAVSGAQVVIDFSLPSAVAAHVAVCEDARVPYLCGVTGLSEQQHHAFEKASRSIPVLWSPNLSVGVNIAFAAVAMMARQLASEFSVKIVDIHHATKRDAPSGTALEFARVIGEAVQFDPQIEYESIREGTHPGEHHIIFCKDTERLELRHCAQSRREFAQGAIRAAVWLSQQGPGRYNMRNLLEKL